MEIELADLDNVLAVGLKKRKKSRITPRHKKYNRNRLDILENKELCFGHSKLCFVLIKDASRTIF